jgi:glycosyltransferase involved in cell wall biosynthesis
MPRVLEEFPSAEFRIVGRSPTPEVLRLAQRRGITVTGAVDDVRTHLGEATLMVAPLRIARGIQNKVLEGMAARVPLVVSPQAFEGIDGEDGRHALVAPDRDSFARAISRLLSDQQQRERLAAAAHELVTTRYVWATAMSKLESLMLECVEAKKVVRSSSY